MLVPFWRCRKRLPASPTAPRSTALYFRKGCLTPGRGLCEGNEGMHVNDKDGVQAEYFACLRSVACPKELATTYPSPDDHIRTLYDVLEHTVQRHPEVL